MEEGLDSARDAYVVVQTATADVNGGDDAVARQLPHVKLVNVVDTINLITTHNTHVTDDNNTIFNCLTSMCMIMCRGSYFVVFSLLSVFYSVAFRSIAFSLTRPDIRK